MGKKKTTKQTSGMEKLRIEVDFDYDKLAEAIVKANKKQEQVGAVSREWMKTLLSFILWPATLMGGLLAVSSFLYGAQTFIQAIFGGASTGSTWLVASEGIALWAFSFFLVAICVFTARTAKEIEKETDRGYIAAVFSDVIALVALVVSLAALLNR